MIAPARPPSRHPARRNRGRTIVLFVGALLFLFEEWLWDRFTGLFRWMGRLPLVARVEAWLSRLPPLVAFGLLCVPMVLLFPVKIVGVWMIATGRIMSGCAVMLAAKLLSTALIARIFLACRVQLLTMAWFARLHGWIVVFRDRIHVWIAQQPAWRSARRWPRHVRSLVRGWFRGRGAAATPHDAPMRPGALSRWRSRRRTVRRAAAPTTPDR